MNSLAEHVVPVVGTLVALLAGVTGLFLGLIRWSISNLLKKLDCIEQKIDSHISREMECRSSLPDRFLSKTEFAEFRNEMFRRWDMLMEERKRDWAEMWQEFNSHRHSQNGDCIRRSK